MPERGEVFTIFSRTDPRRRKGMSGPPSGKKMRVEPPRQKPVDPFKNATSREFRIPPPAGAGGFQFAGIENTIFFLPCKDRFLREPGCDIPVHD
jgi:hypothetical protein